MTIFHKFFLSFLSFMLLGTLPMVADSKAELWTYPSSNPKLTSFSGNGTASSPYLIQSAQDLANLAYVVTDGNDDVTGKYFKMTRDIYLNDFTVDEDGNITTTGVLREWTPIGEHGNFIDDDFQGIFDGNGHTIYGLYMKQQAKRYYVGLFGSTEDAIIKNLTVKNAYIYTSEVSRAHHEVGALVGRATTSTFTNVGVEGCFIYCNFEKYDKEKFDCGGLLGAGENDVTLNDCSFDGNISLLVGNKVYAGGLIGRYYASGTISYRTLRLTRCQAKGTLKAEYKSGQEVYMGGLVGNMSNNTRSYITECVNRLNLRADNNSTSSNMSLVYAYNMAPYVTEMKRSANLGDISFTSNKIKYAYMYLSGECTDGYYDCVNYGHYILPSSRNDSKMIINPGANALHHDNGKNLIVWQEAKPTVELGSRDAYESNGTECSAKELNDQTNLVYRLNREAGWNVWGLYNITEGGTTYQLPMPIACGGISSSLYKNDEGAYMIGSEADLRTLQEMIGKGINAEESYMLVTDLDFTGHAEFEQIGDDNHPFKGTFDGNGHAISGLTVKGRALFGNLSGTVKNLALVGMKFTGGNSSCAPFAYKAGVAADASIENCYAGGNITIADSTNTSTTLAGLCYEASDHNVSIKNSYFRGLMANATNVGNQRHAYYGLVGSNRIGSKLEMNDCYTVFDFPDEAAEGAGIMADTTSIKFNKVNCRYLCTRFDNASGKVKSNGALAACFKDKEGWLTGAYRPVLSSTLHYTLTSHDAQTVYADAIAMDDDSCRNDIWCYELTRETANDPLLWALPKVAICDKDNSVNYLLNCQLHADAPFRYAPPAGSVTKGQMHFPLTFTGDSTIRMLCLPATVQKSSLPEDAHLFVMGKAFGNAEEGYSTYTVECDSVPAGVPFLLYILKNPTQAVDLVLRGEIVGEPQTVAEQDGQQFEIGPSGTFDNKHVDRGCANFEIVGDYLKMKCEDNIDVKPFGAYFNANADMACDGGVLLDEKSNYIGDIIDNYKNRKVTVYLRRELNKAGWNTLCVPFDISSEELVRKYYYGTKIEQLSSITMDDDGTCTLHFTTAKSIEAGKCYLIKPANDDLKWIQLEDKTLCAEPGCTELTSSDGSYTVSFKGTFERKALDGNNAEKGTYFTQDNKIYKVAEGHTILMNGFRCWIETSKANVLSQAKIAHADGTTDNVRMVEVGTTDNGRIYDLQGIETEHPTANRVYIQGGHKYIKR